METLLEIVLGQLVDMPEDQRRRLVCFHYYNEDRRQLSLFIHARSSQADLPKIPEDEYVYQKHQSELVYPCLFVLRFVKDKLLDIRMERGCFSDEYFLNVIAQKAIQSKRAPKQSKRCSPEIKIVRKNKGPHGFMVLKTMGVSQELALWLQNEFSYFCIKTNYVW